MSNYDQFKKISERLDEKDSQIRKLNSEVFNLYNRVMRLTYWNVGITAGFLISITIILISYFIG
jgi:tetrahydromethanopterin S-methyltransferase subunit G